MTYHAVARKRWPRACWIDGEGPWALLAYCTPLTITLWKTREEAEDSKLVIDRLGCGHTCINDHAIFEIKKPLRERHDTRHSS